MGVLIPCRIYSFIGFPSNVRGMTKRLAQVPQVKDSMAEWIFTHPWSGSCYLWIGLLRRLRRFFNGSSYIQGDARFLSSVSGARAERGLCA